LALKRNDSETVEIRSKSLYLRERDFFLVLLGHARVASVTFSRRNLLLCSCYRDGAQNVTSLMRSKRPHLMNRLLVSYHWL